MSKHAELIERLRESSEIGLDPEDAYTAADALEAQVREIEGLRKDAERLDWLDQNLFNREMGEWDKMLSGRDGQNMWVLFAPKGHQGSARNIIDAAKGAPHG